MPNRRALIIIAVLTLMIALFLWTRYMSRSGEFTTLHPLWEGSCEPMEALGSVADLAPLGDGGSVILVNTANGPALQFDGNASVVTLPLDARAGEGRFLSVLGETLYVAQETAAAISVSAAPIGPDLLPMGQLSPVASLPVQPGFSGFTVHESGDLLFSFTGVSDPGSLSHALQRLSGQRKGSLIVSAQGEIQTVATALGFASGLTTLDGTIWVGEPDRGGLRPFTRSETGNWQADTPVFLGTAITGLTASGGRLWAVAQPRFVSFLYGLGSGTYQDNKGRPLPAQMIVVEPDTKRIDQVLLTTDATPVSPLLTGFGDAAPSAVMLAGYNSDRVFRCALADVWRHSERRPASRPVNRRGEQI